MATDTEEQQALELLKRTEVRTMRKDLRSLREADALKERGKIVTTKTTEEQRLEQAPKIEVPIPPVPNKRKVATQSVLQKSDTEERVAEKDLKQYATEQERQQIFLLESQRLTLEQQLDEINSKKDPALKLEKNQAIVKQQNLQSKLKEIADQENKLMNEQKFLLEKEQTTSITSERKSLEQRRQDLDKEIQQIEKKRWPIEKQIQEAESNIARINRTANQIVSDKNQFNNQISTIDKSLREIYSGVITKTEDKRKGRAQEQMVAKEAAAKKHFQEMESVQRHQWTRQPNKNFLKGMPKPVKHKLTDEADQEEQKRKLFIKDVENWAKTSDKDVETPVAPLPPKKN